VQGSYSYGYDLITQTQAGQASYYLVDGLGSTRLLLDGLGQVLNSYEYEAFGETVSQSGTTGNKYQYAGEQLDGTLGDYYLRQRFYDTSSGRFGRIDTYKGSLGNPQTLHRYTYGNDNPANSVDPTGLFSIAEFNAAESIRNILAGIQVNSGAYLISATLNDGDYGLREFLTDFAWNAVVTTAFLALPFLVQRITNPGAHRLPVLGAKGPISDREFNPAAAGGPIRKLTMRNVKITNKGVDKVAQHVRRFEYDPGNEYMVERLRAIASGNVAPTQVDLNYYTHELREGFRYRNLGTPNGQQPLNADEAYAVWNNAHTATLEDYGIAGKETDLFHPNAITILRTVLAHYNPMVAKV
jgi:RHS repeat-associated protein